MNAAAQLRTHLVTAATHLERAWAELVEYHVRAKARISAGEIPVPLMAGEIDHARRAIARALQVLASSESTEQPAPCDAGVDAGTRDF